MQIIINKSTALEGNTEFLLREKLEKLTTFYERIESATVHLKHDETLGENGANISVKLAIPGPDAIAEAHESSMEKAIAEVTEKLRRQLLKVKEKQNRK